MHSDQDTEDTAQAAPPSAEAADPPELDTNESYRSIMVNQENDRLVKSVADFFVATGVSVALAGASLVTYGVSESLLAAGMVAAAVSWVLTVTLALQKRMAFTSTILLFALLAGVGIGTFGVLTSPGSEVMSLVPKRLEPDGLVAERLAFASAIVVALAAWLHWRLYRVPAAVAASIGVFALLVKWKLYFALVGTPMLWAFDEILLGVALFGLSGSAVFAYAINWDLSDTDLHTHRNDVAFWLHLLAALLLGIALFLHTLFWGLSESGVFASAPTVFLHPTICAIALLVNRRVLLVSATASMIVVTAVIINTGVVSFGLLITVLAQVAIAIFVLVCWKRVRPRLLNLFKIPNTWRQRLPGNTH